MSDPSPLDASELTAEAAERRCFGGEGRPAVWGDRSSAWIDRRLGGLIGRAAARSAGLRGREPDLYREVRDEISTRFPMIWQTFSETGRPRTWSAFEPFLQVTLRNAVTKRARKLLGKELLGRLDDAAASSARAWHAADPATARDASALFERAFAALTPDEKAVFHDHFVLHRASAETAERLGLSVGAVYVRRHRALLHFRQVVVEILASDLLALREPDALWQELARRRCAVGHACLLYKLSCRSALSPSQIAERIPGASAELVARAESEFAAELARTLRAFGVDAGLEDCMWEKSARTGRQDDRE